MGQPSWQIQDSIKQIPNFLTDATIDLNSFIKNLAYNGYQQYGGPYVAGPNWAQDLAGQQFKNGLNAFNPIYNFAQGGYRQAQNYQYDPVAAQTFKNGLADIGSYMNPYIKNVINATRQSNDISLGHSLNNVAARSAGAGAFGGSRMGVQEGAAAAQNTADLNQLSANLYNQGYDRATGLMGQDIQNKLNTDLANRQGSLAAQQMRLMGAQGMQGLGDAMSRNNLAYANALSQWGNQRQGVDTMNNQMRYQEFLRGQQYPMQAAQLWGGILGSMPYNTATHTTSFGQAEKQGSSSPLSSILGGLLGGIGTLGGLFGSGGMFGAGGAFSGLFNGLGGAKG